MEFLKTKINFFGKTKAVSKALLAMLMMLSITFSMVMGMQIAGAHTPAWEINTYTYAVVAPDIIGVNQETAIVFWLNAVPPTANGAYGDRWRFNIEVTKPDGSIEKLGPIKSDPVGNAYCLYTPKQVGKYYIQVFFPGYEIVNENKNPNPANTQGAAYVGDYYKPSNSSKVTLTVQEQPIAPLPPAELPTGYWKRPIEGQNREWWTISGNWFSARGYNETSQGYYYKGGGFNPYSTGPSSAHIIWAKPLEMFGGLMGGELSIAGGVGSYYNGMSYEQAFAPPVIIQGRLYYTTPPSAKPNYGTHCVDLRTGEEIWYQNITINYGQVYNYISPNQFGGIPYLWETNNREYKLYDAYTGNWILTLANASTGTTAFSQDGSMLVYIYNSQRGWFAMWNSSLAIWANMPNLWSSNNYWLWRPPQGTIIDWQKGIQWNTTITPVQGASLQKVNAEIAICRATTTNEDGSEIVTDIGYSVKPGDDGKQIWGPVNRTAEPSRIMVSLVDGLYTDYDGETMSWYAYDAYTGVQKWGPSKSTDNAWAMYGGWRTNWAGFGKIYQVGMDGCIHCLDLQTGEKLWTFQTESSGFETTYGRWPLLSASFFGGAPGTGGLKIYALGGHTHLQPLFKGSEMYCVDAETGELLWSIDGWYQAGGPVGADGYMATVNGYDNQLYVFGKGQTATTVTAPQTTVPLGTPVLIQGTVTDQSPGAKDTPAIADESMSAWMEYMYMQKPKPTNATGVTVKLTATDSKGSTADIGTVTSDIDGLFKIMWTPPAEGAYKITANFEGSDSYFASHGVTALGVGPASEAMPTSPTTPTTSSSMTSTPTSILPSPSSVIQPASDIPLTTYIAIAAAAVITAVAAAALLLKRRAK